MKKALTLLIMLLLLCSSVLADGMIHISDKDIWNLQPETQQVAAINYQGGVENLLISIDLNQDIRGDKAVWIFPVPSSPDKVSIDIMKGFPTFRGNDLDTEYNDALAGVGFVMSGYSTFPLGIFPLLFYGTTGGSRILGSLGDVTVYESIQKMGLTTELIATKDQDALTQYLQNKGLNLPQASKDMLNEYVGKDYSFVVSYINDIGQFKSEAQSSDYNYMYRGKSGVPIGVFIKFPTDKIYFPLKPTSVYGSQQIPVLIYVVGHTTPDLYKEIKPQTDVSYYSHGWFTSTPELSAFFNGQTQLNDLKYTKIKINSQSKFFVDDLWIDSSAPASLSIKSFFVRFPWLWGILLFVALSVFSSLLAGKISFRKEPPSNKRLMLHGLWNFLTGLGFLIATIFMKTKNLDPKMQVALNKQGLNVTVHDNRKILYVFLFYVFFIALTIAAVFLLNMVL